MSSVRGANRRASGVPAGRTRPRASSIACSRPSSARGGSAVSMATAQFRYQRRSRSVRPGSSSHGSDSYSGEVSTTPI